MLSRQTVEDDEERIRKLVSDLPDSQRFAVFKRVELEIKDPDTYATFNYFFIAGLHHFYLGKISLGLLNISVFWVGVVFLFINFLILGVLIIAAVSLFEVFELFRSQIIVQDFNNRVMERVYTEITGTPMQR